MCKFCYGTSTICKECVNETIPVINCGMNCGSGYFISNSKCEKCKFL
jgi:hypothetical protein